jgi:hypothetical protein
MINSNYTVLLLFFDYAKFVFIVFVEMPQHKLSDSAQVVNEFPLSESFGRA